MHHIYHTEGLILDSRNYGESGKYFYVFTKDLGMIVAAARGVRKMSSKLRFILHDFAYIKTDLVRGKDFWRITSASKTNELEDLRARPETLKITAGISRLLKRLLAGEDANPELFLEFLHGLKILEKTEQKNALLDIEAVIVLRLLNRLGYIGTGGPTEVLIRSPLEEAVIYRSEGGRRQILREINKALRESML